MLLEQRLLAQHWCPNHIAFLQSYLAASSNCGLYYASSLHRPRIGSHETCSVAACLARNVDPTKYQTKHSGISMPICDGNCPKIELQQEPIRDIIQIRGIPLLKASISNGRVEVEVVEHQVGMDYVAFSHVWSDGLGNKDGNWLPNCQFIHLVQAVNATRSENRDEDVIERPESGTTAPLFWIDTICVPREDTDIKGMALDRMVDIYAGAAMVLDAELYRTAPGTILEAFMRLICSNWMRRLWTSRRASSLAGGCAFSLKGERWTFGRNWPSWQPSKRTNLGCVIL